jgi:hypothetical protein
MKAVLAAYVFLSSVLTSAFAQNYSADDLARRTIERRAVEAAIWGMPLVNTDAMRQAYFRDAGAKYNDICYFSKPQDWKFQVTTPNASTNYIYFNYNRQPSRTSAPLGFWPRLSPAPDWHRGRLRGEASSPTP